MKRSHAAGMILAVTVTYMGCGGGMFGLMAIAATSKTCGPGGEATTIVDTNLTAEQLANAQLITDVVVKRKLSKRAAIISVATALQESSLRNLPGGDADSKGLFQQRISIYGNQTATNPVKSTNAFLDELVKEPNWETRALTDVAASVQRPREDLRGEYAKWEAVATPLVGRYWPLTPSAPAPPSTTATTPQPSPGPNQSHASASPSPTPTVGAIVDPCEKQENQRAVESGPVGTITRPDGLVLTGTPQGRAAAEFALQQLGKWYVWGGTGPDGWDCSGLTQGAWSHAGVAIDRVSEDQINNGVGVPPSQARTGDLAFIASEGTASRPGHVGMVVGSLNGKLMLVHAPGRGKQIKIQPFSNWDNVLVAVRRVG